MTTYITASSARELRHRPGSKELRHHSAAALRLTALSPTRARQRSAR